MAPSSSTLDLFVARARQLYSMPAVAAKVLELTSQPEVDLRALKECIENDPALTARILRAVNSSFFGIGHAVADLRQALALLGARPLKLLVLGFSLPAGLVATTATPRLMRCWRQTLTQAVAARLLAEVAWSEAGDKAFLAGLLRDVGLLVLIRELGPPYLRLLDEVERLDGDAAEQERVLLGFDRTMLSARLLESWAMPAWLVQAVSGSTAAEEQTLSGPRPALSCLVRVAALLAQALAEGSAPALARFQMLMPPARALDCAALERLLAEVQAKVDSLAQVLAVQLAAPEDYRDLLVRAHEEMAAATAEMATTGLGREQPGATAGTDGPVLLPEDVERLNQALLGVAQRLETGPGSRAALPLASPAQRAGPLATILVSALASCRQQRCCLSLLLLGPRGSESQHTVAWERARRLLTRLAGSMQPMSQGVFHGTDALAWLLPDCDRAAAVGLGNEVLAALAPGGKPRPDWAAGVATLPAVPPNFPPAVLIEAADRCLGASRSSGGVLKSIEIH